MKIWEELNKDNHQPDWWTGLPNYLRDATVIDRNSSLQRLHRVKLLDL